MPKPRITDRREEIRELYRSGLSTSKIAALVGNCTYGAICWIVRDIARDRNTAISMSKPPKSMKKGACHQRARGIVRRRLGRPLQTNEHVHHRDHDYTNNDPDNLQLLSAAEHQRLHPNWRRRWRG
jgi:hypothetical protein